VPVKKKSNIPTNRIFFSLKLLNFLVNFLSKLTKTKRKNKEKTRIKSATQNSILVLQNTIPPYIQKMRIRNPLTDLRIFDKI